MSVVTYNVSDTSLQRELMNEFIGSLKGNKISAVGFFNEKKRHMKDGLNLFQVDLTRSWIESGMDAGNHTSKKLTLWKSFC